MCKWEPKNPVQNQRTFDLYASLEQSLFWLDVILLGYLWLWVGFFGTYLPLESELHMVSIAFDWPITTISTFKKVRYEFVFGVSLFLNNKKTNFARRMEEEKNVEIENDWYL